MLQSDFMRSGYVCWGVSMLMLVSLLLFANGAQAESSTPIDRYLTRTQQALPEQADLLSQTFHVHFPRSVFSVGDAVRYVLLCSGYRLMNVSLLPNPVQILLSQPLPQVHRKLGPITLREGLLTLMGEPFLLVVDPVHRCIGFRLKPNFQTIYCEE